MNPELREPPLLDALELKFPACKDDLLEVLSEYLDHSEQILVSRCEANLSEAKSYSDALSASTAECVSRLEALVYATANSLESRLSRMERVWEDPLTRMVPASKQVGEALKSARGDIRSLAMLSSTGSERGECISSLVPQSTGDDRSTSNSPRASAVFGSGKLSRQESGEPGPPHQMRRPLHSKAACNVKLSKEAAILDLELAAFRRDLLHVQSGVHTMQEQIQRIDQRQHQHDADRTKVRSAHSDMPVQVRVLAKNAAHAVVEQPPFKLTDGAASQADAKPQQLTQQLSASIVSACPGYQSPGVGGARPIVVPKDSPTPMRERPQDEHQSAVQRQPSMPCVVVGATPRIVCNPTRPKASPTKGIGPSPVLLKVQMPRHADS